MDVTSAPMRLIIPKKKCSRCYALSNLRIDESTFIKLPYSIDLIF